MLPFGLEEGLHLETSGYMLPWGSTFEHLREIGEPELAGRGTRRLLWRAERCLGGIACDVAVFENEYQIGKPFSSAQLWLALDEAYRDAKDAGAVIRAHRIGVEALSAALGPPLEYDEGYLYLDRRAQTLGTPTRVEPWATWDLGGVRVRRYVWDKMGMAYSTIIDRAVQPANATDQGLCGLASCGRPSLSCATGDRLYCPWPLIGPSLHGPSCCARIRNRGASPLGAGGGRPFQVLVVAS